MCCELTVYLVTLENFTIFMDSLSVFLKVGFSSANPILLRKIPFTGLALGSNTIQILNLDHLSVMFLKEK